MAFSNKPKSAATVIRDRIVICGSMGFFHQMAETRSLLQRHGVKCVIPDAEEGRPDNELDEINLKRSLSMRHIRRVRDGKTLGILVLNYDKHGVPDYIGANSFAEIAIAFSHYKRIFLYQSVPTFYREELTAWGVTALNGNLALLVREYRASLTSQRQQLRQKTLFEN